MIMRTLAYWACAVCVAAAIPGSARAEADAETYRFIGGEKVQLKFIPATIGEIADQILSDEGVASLPTGSFVNVKGKTPAEARATIVEQLKKDTTVVNPQVRILVLDYPPRKVYVAGQVRTPKSIVLTPGVPL